MHLFICLVWFDLISHIVKILELAVFFIDLLILNIVCFFFFRFFLDMNTKSVEDLMESSTEVHFSGFHMDNGLEQRKAGTEEPTTSAFDEYRQPFVIGLCFFCVNQCSCKIVVLSCSGILSVCVAVKGLMFWNFVCLCCSGLVVIYFVLCFSCLMFYCLIGTQYTVLCYFWSMRVRETWF